MTDKTCNVLFLCTGNSARSILAEALLRRLGGERLRAFSAGSQPKGVVHPMAIEVLRAHGHDTTALRSKSWDEFATPTAPRLDFVFTVCGNAAGETCPVWPGGPATAHWGIDDPAAFSGPEDEQRARFEHAYRELERRIQAFVEVLNEDLDRRSLEARLKEIGAGG